MALLWIDGFDLSDSSTKAYASVPGSSTTTRFSSGRSASLGNLAKNFTASTKNIFGCAFRSDGSPGNVNAAYVAVLGDGGTTQHMYLQFQGSQLVLCRGTRVGTTLATSATIQGNSQWNYLEMASTIDSSAGTCVVRWNGVTVINYTGNTKNGGTNSSIDSIQFQQISSSTCYVDDFYICDGTGSSPYNDFLGDVKVISLSPTGAGASTQFTPDTGSNYARVNEVPYSAANYVQDGTTGHRDTYAMADLTGSPTILAVQNNVIAKKTDAGALSLKPALKSGSTVYYGSTAVLSTNDVTLTDLRTVDPNTSSAWTASGVNALEAGMEVA